MKEVKITSEYITLGQIIKYLGMVDSGAMVKEFVLTQDITVNHEKEQRRGRKLYPGDHIIINNSQFVVK